MAVYFADLDDYGKGADLDVYLNKYRLYFDGKYSVSAIVEAIHKHCERKNHIPKVADLIAILNPEKPKITQAEFIHAKKQWELEGYKPFSYYGQTVKEFEAQEEKSRNIEPVADIPLAEVTESVKRKLLI